MKLYGCVVLVLCYDNTTSKERKNNVLCAFAPLDGGTGLWSVRRGRLTAGPPVGGGVQNLMWLMNRLAGRPWCAGHCYCCTAVYMKANVVWAECTVVPAWIPGRRAPAPRDSVIWSQIQPNTTKTSNVLYILWMRFYLESKQNKNENVFLD